MQNLQRGFIVPLLLVTIAILLVGGGAYVYSQKQNPPATETQLTQATSTEQTSQGTSTVEEISWNIEKANPSIVDDNDYRKYEQVISVDVTFTDKHTQRYSLGKDYGCTGSNVESSRNGRRVFGQVKCYFALTGVDYAAYTENGRFVVGRFADDASGKTNGETTIVLEI